jgi:hypothetical protein
MQLTVCENNRLNLKVNHSLYYTKWISLYSFRADSNTKGKFSGEILQIFGDFYLVKKYVRYGTIGPFSKKY